ncbi:MAG: hypothetical protein C0613_16010 [Desulfobulbaceae bacterium]|nr:MAG: hypothetical protein C0613_16010 [Desulfobulbaceae bacterium]
MSWISDVREELAGLDVSRGQLRKFGLSVGAVLLAVGGFLWLRNHAQAASIVGGIGLVLVLSGLVYPRSLFRLYTVWMGAAFVIGWPVSRVVLSLAYFLALTSIGLISRIFGKNFLEEKHFSSANTFWVKKERGKPSNYEKMY